MIAWLAFAASSSAVHCPALAVASSRSSYFNVKVPTFIPASSRAIWMPLTMVSVCALALPVRGRLETILMTLGSWGAGAGADGDAAGAGDALGADSGSLPQATDIPNTARTNAIDLMFRLQGPPEGRF